MANTYDTQCFDLAEVFLSDAGLFGVDLQKHCDALAKDIQTAIEDYIEALALGEVAK